MQARNLKQNFGIIRIALQKLFASRQRFVKLSQFAVGPREVQANEPARVCVRWMIESGRENRDRLLVPSQLRLAKPDHQFDLWHGGIELSGAIKRGKRF